MFSSDLSLSPQVIKRFWHVRFPPVWREASACRHNGGPVTIDILSKAPRREEPEGTSLTSIIIVSSEWCWGMRHSVLLVFTCFFLLRRQTLPMANQLQTHHYKHLTERIFLSFYPTQSEAQWCCILFSFIITKSKGCEKTVSKRVFLADHLRQMFLSCSILFKTATLNCWTFLRTKTQKLESHVGALLNFLTMTHWIASVLPAVLPQCFHVCTKMFLSRSARHEGFLHLHHQLWQGSCHVWGF